MIRLTFDPARSRFIALAATLEAVTAAMKAEPTVPTLGDLAKVVGLGSGASERTRAQAIRLALEWQGCERRPVHVEINRNDGAERVLTRRPRASQPGEAVYHEPPAS